MFKDIRDLAKQSIVYGTGIILTRGVGFLLIPLYTQHLSPEDYGILSITSALGSVLLGILPLGIPEAALRFYFDTSDQERQRVIIGSLWLTSVLFITFFIAILLVLGPFISPWIFPNVSFSPYLLLAIITAGIQAIKLLPLAFFRAQEKANQYVAFSVGSFLLTTLLSILLVSVLQWKAIGALIARFVGPAVAAIGATILLTRYVKLRIRPDIVRAGLLFGIPMIPTSMFGWLLRLSDPIVMQQYIDMADIGIYSLGSQLGNAVSILGTAINSAWSPFYYRAFQEHGKKTAPVVLAPIITYFMLVTVFIALGVMVFSPEIMQLLARPDYYSAHLVASWVAISSIIQVFNWITRKGIMYAKKTFWDPLLYLAGGSVNIGLNLLLLPRVGYIAAAWSTLAGFAFQGILTFIISQRVCPMIYEYKRLSILVGSAICIFLLSRTINLSSIWLSIAIKATLLVTYPILLSIAGFLTQQERKAIDLLFTRAKQGLFS